MSRRRYAWDRRRAGRTPWAPRSGSLGQLKEMGAKGEAEKTFGAFADRQIAAEVERMRASGQGDDVMEHLTNRALNERSTNAERMAAQRALFQNKGYHEAQHVLETLSARGGRSAELAQQMIADNGETIFSSARHLGMPLRQAYRGVRAGDVAKIAGSSLRQNADLGHHAVLDGLLREREVNITDREAVADYDASIRSLVNGLHVNSQTEAGRLAMDPATSMEVVRFLGANGAQLAADGIIDAGVIADLTARVDPRTGKISPPPPPPP